MAEGHTYEELHGMKVAKLREIADELEDERLDGHNAMHKEHLLPLLCQVLGIEAHVHHEVVGIDKKGVKAEIKALKAERDAALEARDRKLHKSILRKIHRLKRSLHKATV